MTAPDREAKPTQTALVYVRVASLHPGDDQKLRTQEQRCRSYASAQGYVVERVFTDAGMSGSDADRPGLRAMLDHLEVTNGQGIVVVTEDAARLARDVGLMVELSDRILKAGARLEFCDAERASQKSIPRFFLSQCMGRAQP